MKEDRRSFLKQTGLAAMGLASPGIARAHFTSLVKGNTKKRITLDFARTRLEDGSQLATPFWHIDSQKDGPSLLLIAAQHGHEVQGAEVARRFREICDRLLIKGSVWLIPMANRQAIWIRDRMTNPADGKLTDMNRSWPGDPAGSDTERIAHSLDEAVVRHCTHAVDMHCWSDRHAAQTNVSRYRPSLVLAEVTTTRFLSSGFVEPHQGDPTPPVSRKEKMMFRQLIEQREKGAIVIELSGQNMIQESQVAIGLSSMVNIAKRLGMMEGDPEPFEGKRVVYRDAVELKSPCSGLFTPALRRKSTTSLAPSDHVEKGQVIGHILRANDLETIPVISPVSGYLSWFGRYTYVEDENPDRPARFNNLAIIVPG